MNGSGRGSGLIGERLSRRRFLRLITGVAAGSAGAALLSACAVPSPHHHTVDITGVGHFMPGSIRIPVGDSIVWNNKDIVPHTVTCDPKKAFKPSDVALPNGAQPWNSGVINPGQTWAHQFNTAGRFVYFSMNDEQNGFIGTIVVG